jgi:hypothetical protein
VRALGIWISGLIASIIIGGGIGSLVGPTGALPGMVAGVCVFACARLWLGELYRNDDTR